MMMVQEESTEEMPPIEEEEGAEPTHEQPQPQPRSPPSSPRRRARTPSNHIVFPARSSEASMLRQQHPLFCEPADRGDRPHPQDGADLMGPLLRRKKVVSLPLGMGGDFFVHGTIAEEGSGAVTPSLRRRQLSHNEGMVRQGSHRTRQVSPRSPGGTSHSPGGTRRRVKQGSFMDGLIRRKQVSLDLLGPNDFFAIPTKDEEAILEEVPEKEVEDDVEKEVKTGEPPDATSAVPPVRLFLPLRFSAPIVTAIRKGQAPSQSTSALSVVDEETSAALSRQSSQLEKLELQMSMLRKKIDEEQYDPEKREQWKSVTDSMLDTYRSIEQEGQALQSKLLSSAEAEAEAGAETDVRAEYETEDEDDEDSNILRATRTDKIKAGAVFFIMLAFTVVVCMWHTHIQELIYIYTPVGLACVTDCPGDVHYRDFFHGHHHFETGEVIDLSVNLDPVPVAEGHRDEGHGVDDNVTGSDSEESSFLLIEVVGNESGEVKATTTMGPANAHVRVILEETITVDFAHPEEAHFINVKNADNSSDVVLSFTLHAGVMTPLADHSVLIAALIMVFVYAFILIEVIHRTLVAVFGSMLALLFLFIMHGGATVAIRHIMLHLEWSTLGLLFGMMLLVGELSHTGIFEWCAVRLLLLSGGSFCKLLLLLCILTAVASAFLDNVTTMLLIAPVTIDMCNILDVDPRPYLISEVMLSNVGGTATLIGDPPNIIIGTSYDEIDFGGFIVNVLPAIFLFIMPATLLLLLWIYRYYLTSSKMRVLDTAKLKKTYPIYDQPRLMIAGTTTFFVILTFFLHSVHHKDTAWIALFGAFITIAFTNPHDVQDALRNHVEWDTLLFFAGLFVLVEACAEMGLLAAIGTALANYIESQPEESQLAVAITLVLWVSAIVSAFLDNIPYTATMIPVISILAEKLPNLPLSTLAWALSFGACLGGNGTLLGASANIVTAGISKNRGFDISFLNFFYPGMLVLIESVAIANLYMLVRYVWVAGK